MVLVDNKTAPRRTALPSPRSTSVAPPIQKAAPPTDSSIEPSKMPIVLVPRTPELPQWRQRPGKWTAAPHFAVRTKRCSSVRRSDEDTQDLINQTLKRLNELTDSSFLLKSAHEGWADILFNKLSNLETLTQHINEHTVTLMDGFKQTLANVLKTYSLFELEFKKTVDAAQVIQAMFLALHEDTLSSHIEVLVGNKGGQLWKS
ncbi:uncharacterized protein EI90DRAFT_3021931 [Cantharellus anzutake]|uniref:uncharacterized protein n=1 Tax=Cantharellus anzutake TaxID=1750568 RepID=UPI0019033FA9|nr:uncharacterized protein EI90DRAFT_3021931 [Cantharellus anzutake]KAF8315481.1 hypothetical protein EI90DRAFT_3021931 [Cantharellus anzutake]